MESPDVTREQHPEPRVGPPPQLGQWRWRILLAAVLLVPFFVPVPRVLERSVIISALGDRLHVILLCGVTFFLYWYGPLRGRLLRAALATAAIGGAIEGIQHFVGRHALWHDFYQDLVGIGIATGFVLWRGHRSRPGFALMAVLLLLVPWQLREMPLKAVAAREVGARFPLLADFEKSRDALLWGDDYGSTLTLGSVEDGGHGGVLRLETEASDQWPSAGMTRFPRDWSAHGSLQADVRVAAGADSVRGSIVLTDYDGYRQREWKQINFFATSGWQTVTVPLQDRELRNTDRKLDLGDIYLLKIYLWRPQQHTVLEIDNVRLD